MSLVSFVFTVNIFLFLDDNVLKVAAVAEKYQNAPLISKCKNVMVRWLKKCTKQTQNMKDHESGLLLSMKIITKANDLDYQDVVNTAVDAISRFNSKLYSKPNLESQTSNKQLAKNSAGTLFIPSPMLIGFGFGSTTQQENLGTGFASQITPATETKKDCAHWFSKLPFSLQNEIRRKRLERVDNGQFFPYNFM